MSHAPVHFTGAVKTSETRNLCAAKSNCTMRSLNAGYASVPATFGICFCEIISDKSIPIAGTLVRLSSPMCTLGIIVRNIPDGAPGFGGSEGLSPAASAALESTMESTLPVSMPMRMISPSPMRASTHGVPSQSKSGTSATNLIPVMWPEAWPNEEMA